MYYFIILLSLMLFTGSAQPDTSSVLSVTAEGSAQLPADIVQFDVTLNAEEDTPESAYQLHKRREEALVRLLEKYEVKEADIDFQPVSIFRSRRAVHYNEEVTIYQTRQLVRVTIRDFDYFEQLQLGLIKYGFDSFSGYFLSSHEQQGREEALRRAMQAAKAKARLIAEEAGMELGSITNIRYDDLQYQPAELQSHSVIREGGDRQLMRYNQTITVTASVKVDFQLMARTGGEARPDTANVES